MSGVRPIALESSHAVDTFVLWNSSWHTRGSPPPSANTGAPTGDEQRASPDRQRLSALDASFLRLETPQAHMHVGWTGVFASPRDCARPTLQALRERVASRLDDVPWCRWRLQNAPLGVSEPRWVEDRNFNLEQHHVLALGDPDEAVSNDAFAALRDELLSVPLDRSRALWQIFLIPCLQDGRVGLIGKVHHALVDGIAALQIVSLVVDGPPALSRHRASLPPASPRGPLGWALDQVSATAGDGLAVLKATAAAATQPQAVARDALRVLRAAREDLLPRAPDCALNVPIGGRRTLVGYHASRSDLRAARAGGGTINDIGLTVVAGALRALAIERAGDPRPVVDEPNRPTWLSCAPNSSAQRSASISRSRIIVERALRLDVCPAPCRAGRARFGWRCRRRAPTTG